MTNVNWETVRPYIVPAAIVVAAAVVGVVLHLLASKRLAASRFARRHVWAAMALDALDVAVIIWVVSAGIHVALQFTRVPLNVLHIIDDVLIVLVWASVTICGARFARNAVLRVSSGASEQIASGTLFASVSQGLVVILGVTVILSCLGVRITPILGALGIGGLAVALALQPPLANLFSGLQLIASRQIRPGDYVWIANGQEGFVEDINWRSVAIRTNANTMVIVPNLTLATATFVNYKLGQPYVAVTVPVKVAYGSDLEFVEKMIRDAVGRLDGLRGGREHLEPTIIVECLADATLQLTVSFMVAPNIGQMRARDAFLRAYYAALTDRNIAAPSSNAVVAPTSTPVPTHP